MSDQNSDTQACYAGNPHEYDEIKCSVCGATKALGIAEHLLDEIERVQAALARVLAKADAIEADGDGTPAATVARAIASEIRRAVNGE